MLRKETKVRSRHQNAIPFKLQYSRNKGVSRDVSEKARAPHSSTLARKIPWTEEAGRLQSMGSLRVGQD